MSGPAVTAPTPSHMTAPSEGALRNLVAHSPIEPASWLDIDPDDACPADDSRMVQIWQDAGFESFDAMGASLATRDDPWNFVEDDTDEDTIAGLKALFMAHGGSASYPTSVLPSSPMSLGTPPASAASGNTAGATARAGGVPRIRGMFTGLDADQAKALKAMEAYLTEVNGQDAYSVTSMALGTLKRSEYLVLPDYMRGVRWPVKASAVGAAWDQASSPVKFADFIHIYTLNKTAAKEAKDPVFFGLLRAEAVKMGWYQGQSEVVYMPVEADAVTTYLTDRVAIEESIAAARSAAFLIPFMAEQVFRTTGHHYLTGAADEYERKYQAMCNACLVPDMTRSLRASELWHWAMHWVSPRVAREALVALSGTPRLPNAIAIRANAAPAGTAIITTTDAVILAMESCNWAKEVKEHGGYDFDLIHATTKAIKADVTRYHNTYFAYGATQLTADEADTLAKAVSEAQKFAPIAQGFIDAMYSDSSLARAKALRKHADGAPGLYRRAVRVFRNLSRADTTTIKSIFSPMTDEEIAATQKEAKKKAAGTGT